MGTTVTRCDRSSSDCVSRSERCRPAAAWLLFVAVSMVGCGSLGGPAAGPTPSPGTTAAAAVEQALFRVRYSGVDGRGRLRLTLRSAGEDFQLSAADPFGRSLWSFAGTGDDAVLLDHREATYCRLQGEVAIEVVALSELPVRMLPRLLSGRLPVDADPPVVVPPDGGEVDLVDGRGRRWTARFDGGVLASWTLWRDGAPILWWQRQDEGGILSHRDGAQAIWTRTAHERVPGVLEPLEPPSSYVPVRCGEGDEDDLA